MYINVALEGVLCIFGVIYLYILEVACVVRSISNVYINKISIFCHN